MSYQSYSFIRLISWKRNVVIRDFLLSFFDFHCDDVIILDFNFKFKTKLNTFVFLLRIRSKSSTLIRVKILNFSMKLNFDFIFVFSLPFTFVFVLVDIRWIVSYVIVEFNWINNFVFQFLRIDKIIIVITSSWISTIFFSLFKLIS